MTESDAEQPAKRKGRPSGKRGTFTFRVTTGLRARLEAAAVASERPVSEEIERRLERSFEDVDLLLSYFGSSETLKLSQAVSVLARQVEAQTGLKWTEDGDTRQHFADAIQRFMELYFYHQGIERKYFGLSSLTDPNSGIAVSWNAAEAVAAGFGLRSPAQEEIAAFIKTPEGAAALARFQAGASVERETAAGAKPRAESKSDGKRGGTDK